MKDNSDSIIKNAYYSYGVAAWEALVAIYGHGLGLECFNAIKAGKLLVCAFEEKFGITHDQYLKEVSIHLAKPHRSLLP